MGLSTYSSDDRFFVEHTRHLGNWALRIKNAREDDEGLYECQISSHPPQSIFIELRIVGKFLYYRTKYVKYYLLERVILRTRGMKIIRLPLNFVC